LLIADRLRHDVHLGQFPEKIGDSSRSGAYPARDSEKTRNTLNEKGNCIRIPKILRSEHNQD
jgi:hypothetical protein